ncbi:hypothetical protein CBL_09910, partial [Carabus blaptoides fortunei]
KLRADRTGLLRQTLTVRHPQEPNRISQRTMFLHVDAEMNTDGLPSYRSDASAPATRSVSVMTPSGN